MFDKIKFNFGSMLPLPVFHALYEIVRERPRAKSIDTQMKALGLTSWRTADLTKTKTSDTLFILGSGRSINDISSSRWMAISEHDSYAINFWLCHTFLPTIYFFEAIQVSTKYADHDWRFSVLKTLSRCMTARETDYAEIPKIVDELRIGESAWYEMIPPAFKRHLYVARTKILPGRTYGDAKRILQKEMRRGSFNENGEIASIPKFGYSLGTLLSLASCLRYKKVVLCGIDMKNPDYFYDDPERYPEMVGFRSSPSLKHHMSFQPWGLRCSLRDYVIAFRDVVMSQLEIDLYVENVSSGLYPEIAAAPASLFES